MLIHQAPANRWSLVSHMASVRPSVCSETKKRKNAKVAPKENKTSAWWITKFARLVQSYCLLKFSIVIVIKL